jgi:hypothetical protein
MNKLTKKRKLNSIKHNKTHKSIKLPNLTPSQFNDVRKSNGSIVVSYAPTINEKLVSLKSIEREDIVDCNNKKAFALKEPLKIEINNKCVPYYDKLAINLLLHNLSANKHVIIDNIIPPVQSQSNCWFNTMFVVLFVSDKGRKFFHFFRQLMIEGIQSNGNKIPLKLKNGFALLNYAIDACLTGNKYAFILDTNAIIKTIYNFIPTSYKQNIHYITDVGEAGNPLYYYDSLIHYLENKSIQLTFIQNATSDWKEQIMKKIYNVEHLPHIIILEIYDGKNKTSGESGKVTNKQQQFKIKGAKYSLDSCLIRDTSQQHFSATLTCEKKEMAYDGMSFHRLVPLNWKTKINTDFYWEFKGSTDLENKPLQWNFKHCYQMLLYYRVK